MKLRVSAVLVAVPGAVAVVSLSSQAGPKMAPAEVGAVAPTTNAARIPVK